MFKLLWTKRGFVIGAMVAGLMLAAVACGTSEEGATGPAAAAPVVTQYPDPPTSVPTTGAAATQVPTPTPTQVPVPVVSDQPKYGGQLTVAQTAEPPTFDPHATSLSLTTNHVHLTHNRVIRYKSLASPENARYGDLILYPSLAESWDISGGGTVFTFKLRKGVAWHKDEPLNGRELTSEDIARAWKRMHEDSSRFSGFYDGLLGVETPDRYTVVQTIDRPLASWLHRIADGEAAWITNQDFVDFKGADFGVAQDSLVGTGPFLYDEAQPGASYTYVRNPDYWEQPYPYLESMKWIVLPDRSAQEAAFVSGQLDYYVPRRPEDFDRIVNAVPNVRLRETTGLANTTDALMFNMDLPKWQDVRVRLAVLFAVNDERVIEDLYSGRGKYNACIPSALRGFSLEQDELRELYPYDPEKAKALLAEAGFGPGEFKFEIMMFTSYSQDNQDIAIMRQADLQDAGFDVTINPIPVGQGRPRVIEGNFDTVQQPHSTGVEPDEMLSGFVPGGPRNFMRVDDPKVTQWMAQQEVEFNREKRGAITKEFSRYCAEQALYVPSPERVQQQLVQGRVKNFALVDVASDEPDEKYVWIEP